MFLSGAALVCALHVTLKIITKKEIRSFDFIQCNICVKIHIIYFAAAGGTSPQGNIIKVTSEICEFRIK
jgi:hypothetical protein